MHGGGSIVNNTFTNNRGSHHGGGLQVASWSPMLIEGDTVIGNTATYGAGMNLLGCRYATVRNNLIVDNHATSYGGGIYLANPDAVHTLVHDNTIVNCSSGNDGGGGICFGGVSLDTAYNNIVVGCTGNGIWAANTQTASLTIIVSLTTRLLTTRVFQSGRTKSTLIRCLLAVVHLAISFQRIHLVSMLAIRMTFSMIRMALETTSEHSRPRLHCLEMPTATL